MTRCSKGIVSKFLFEGGSTEAPREATIQFFKLAQPSKKIIINMLVLLMGSFSAEFLNVLSREHTLSPGIDPIFIGLCIVFAFPGLSELSLL